MEKYIYKITNLINNKCYIGQTTDYKRRFIEHKRMYQENDKTLYKAFKKYGIDNFSFEVLEKCKNYNEREIYYIEKFDSYHNGYNMTLGGENPPINKGENSPFKTHEIEDVIRVKDLIINTDLQLKEIAKITGYSESSIKRINRGLLWREKDKKYPLRVCKTSFSEEDITDIINMLLDRKLKHKEIAELFGVARTTISAINKGKNYRREGYEYPLRKKRVV